MLRLASFLIGAAIIAATAHAAIMAGGGYVGHAHPVQIAVAAGLVVGSLALGCAWSEGRRTLTVALLVSLLAGEAFGLMMTAERVVSQREASAAPIAMAQARRHQLQQELDQAEATRRAADAAITSQAALPGCKANCAKLLQANADMARSEVERLRGELGAVQEGRSSTPLADRLGIGAWLLDLSMAALLAISANGLGACLIAFAAHGRGGRQRESTPAEATQQPKPNAEPVALLEVIPAPAAPRRPAPSQEVARFAVETLRPAPTAAVPARDLAGHYEKWCQAQRIEPLPKAEFAEHLARMFDGVGRKIVRGKIVGVELRSLS